MIKENFIRTINIVRGAVEFGWHEPTCMRIHGNPFRHCSPSLVSLPFRVAPILVLAANVFQQVPIILCMLLLGAMDGHGRVRPADSAGRLRRERSLACLLFVATA